MNILPIIYTVVSFAPVIFVFGFIIAMMYNANKHNIRKSKKDIFGYLFVILYAIVFIGTIVVAPFNKQLSLVGFGIILFSILGLLFFGAVSSSKDKGPDSIIVNGRLISYDRKSSKRNVDGYMIDYYTLRFLYNFGGGESKECVTLEEYSMSQIQYLQSLGNDVKLEVYKDNCRLLTGVRHIKDEALRTTAPHPDKTLTTKSMYNVELLATIACCLPNVIVLIFLVHFLWDISKVMTIIVGGLTLITTLTPVVNAFKYYRSRMKIDREGVRSTTTDYTITQLSNSRYTIEYTFITSTGERKPDKERIDADIYFAIKKLNGPLPIIVYENDSIVDVNLINNLKDSNR